MNKNYDEQVKNKQCNVFDSLTLFHELKNRKLLYGTMYKLFIYASVEAFVAEPTEEEYRILADCIEYAYSKAEEVDLGKFADCVCQKYSKKEFTLDELQKMSKWDILDLYI